jgi:hypothetical protein
VLVEWLPPNAPRAHAARGLEDSPRVRAQLAGRFAIALAARDAAEISQGSVVQAAFYFALFCFVFVLFCFVFVFVLFWLCVVRMVGLPAGVNWTFFFFLFFSPRFFSLPRAPLTDW